MIKIETIKKETIWLNPEKIGIIRLDGNQLLIYKTNGKIIKYTLTDKSLKDFINK